MAHAASMPEMRGLLRAPAAGRFRGDRLASIPMQFCSYGRARGPAIRSGN
ncbi:Uncharacterised protein [Bordetella pertussis]|nr:Uncharacterised protein [Bordetella pertussis]